MLSTGARCVQCAGLCVPCCCVVLWGVQGNIYELIPEPELAGALPSQEAERAGAAAHGNHADRAGGRGVDGRAMADASRDMGLARAAPRGPLRWHGHGCAGEEAACHVSGGGTATQCGVSSVSGLCVCCRRSHQVADREFLFCRPRTWGDVARVADQPRCNRQNIGTTQGPSVSRLISLAGSRRVWWQRPMRYYEDGERFVACSPWQQPMAGNDENIPVVAQRVVLFARDRPFCRSKSRMARARP